MKHNKQTKERKLYPNAESYVRETSDTMLKNVKKPYFDGESAFKPVMLEHNTMKISYKDGSEAIRFHKTDIVTWNKGNVILNGAGYCPKSQKTRERIVKYAALYGVDVSVFVRDGKCYFTVDGNTDNERTWKDNVTFQGFKHKPAITPKDAEKEKPEPAKAKAVIGAKKPAAKAKMPEPTKTVKNTVTVKRKKAFDF
jgi:hypothetical protein